MEIGALQTPDLSVENKTVMLAGTIKQATRCLRIEYSILFQNSWSPNSLTYLLSFREIAIRRFSRKNPFEEINILLFL